MDTEGKSVKDELFILGTLKLCLLKVIKLSTELTESAAYVNAINLLISERQHFLLNLICLVGEQKKKTPQNKIIYGKIQLKSICLSYISGSAQLLKKKKIKLETLEQNNMLCPVGTNIWHIYHF